MPFPPGLTPVAARRTSPPSAQVPQLQEMSDVLERSTGWRIRPVAGLMHPREFLAGLAFK